VRWRHLLRWPVVLAATIVFVLAVATADTSRSGSPTAPAIAVRRRSARREIGVIPRPVPHHRSPRAAHRVAVPGEARMAARRAAIRIVWANAAPFLRAVAARDARTVPGLVDRTTSHHAAPLGRSGASGGYRDLIRSIWTSDADWAISVVYGRPGHRFGESNGVATAHNRCCYGLFAIDLSQHANWFRDVGCTTAQWADPTCNVKAARRGYELNGRQPWE
jgi:hypothetical protein